MTEHEGEVLDDYSPVSALEIVGNLRRLTRKVDEALAFLAEKAKETAAKKRAYKRAKALAMLKAGESVTREYGLQRPTSPEKEAWVDLQVDELAFEADLAESLEYAAHQAVKARTAELSAWQTLGGIFRAEANLTRTGPDMGHA